MQTPENPRGEPDGEHARRVTQWYTLLACSSCQPTHHISTYLRKGPFAFFHIHLGSLTGPCCRDGARLAYSEKSVYYASNPTRPPCILFPYVKALHDKKVNGKDLSIEVVPLASETSPAHLVGGFGGRELPAETLASGTSQEKREPPIPS